MRQTLSRTVLLGLVLTMVVPAASALNVGVTVVATVDSSETTNPVYVAGEVRWEDVGPLECAGFDVELDGSGVYWCLAD